METVEKDCRHKDCIYRSHISPINASTDECCDYLLHTGKVRGCKISECDKYRTGRKIRKSAGHLYRWVVE